MDTPRRTSTEQDALRERVREAAQPRGGVFRRSDLASWDLEPTLVVTMVRNGSWVRLHHGVYADRLTVDAAVTVEARHLLNAAAAVAAIAGPVSLFGPTAALACGLPVHRRALGTVHLVRPRGHDSRALRRRVSSRDHLPAAAIHVIDITDDEVTKERGLPTVTRELAAWSAALFSPPDWAVAVLDAAAWQSPEALRTMEEYGTRWPRLVGTGEARRALQHARTGAQSPLESLSRVRLVREGLAEPSLQVPISDRDGLIGYVDMLFDDLGVVGEADGHVKYETREDLLREKSREDRLRATGLAVVRWDWAQASGSMRKVAASIMRASAHSRPWRRSA